MKRCAPPPQTWNSKKRQNFATVSPNFAVIAGLSMNVELARKSLAERDGNVLIPALRVLAKTGSLTDLQAIMAHIKSRNPDIHREAVSAAGSVIRNNLLTHFDKVAPHVRRKLGAVMESLDPHVVSELGKDVRSRNEERRLRAVRILGLLRKNPKVRDVLAELVSQKDEKIRATAIKLLGSMVGPNDQDVILSLLSDPDKRVRANTVEGLERLGNKRMIPILLRFRKDPNNRIRGNVLKALFSLGYCDIEEDILEMLRSKDNFMNASALWVIMQTKVASREIEDSAGFHLVSDSEMVMINARKALTVMGTPRAKGYLRYLDDTAQASSAR
ncbi:MAG: hypothetical protein GF344_19195 [Chitinivibrionales bacterium]|nr:hypothetical protein [Chitinivibrionales bacterium]MBD3358750.1 hypothetical protein [Chitinivibrionales bacterium]